MYKVALMIVISSEYEFTQDVSKRIIYRILYIKIYNSIQTIQYPSNSYIKIYNSIKTIKYPSNSDIKIYLLIQYEKKKNKKKLLL